MRQSMVFRVAAVGMGMALVTGCASREAPAPRPAPPVVVVPPTRPTGTAEYMNVTSSNALLVVRASELALKRSTRGSTLQLASRLRRRLNILPSASMLMLDRVMFDGLSRATDFDTAYRRTMKAAVENCVSSHGSYAQSGGSPTLRPVARFAASACRDELPLGRIR